MHQMGAAAEEVVHKTRPASLVNHHSTELFLIKEIEAENPILVAHGNSRPPGVERPLGANDLRIRIVQRRHISEGEVARDLLLHGQPRLRQFRSAGESRVYLELVYS